MFTLKRPFHVTFDSNTIEFVLNTKPYTLESMGQNFDPELEKAFCKINAAIEAHDVIPFVSETYFSSEAIPKKARKSNMGTPCKPTIDCTYFNDKTIRIRFSLSPSVIVELPQQFMAVKEKLMDGFGYVLPVSRIAFPYCKEIKNLYAPNINVSKFREDSGNVARFLEDKLGASLKYVKATLKAHCSILEQDLPITDLFNKTNLSDKKVAKLMAELADCDMICAHIASKNHYLCTLDESKTQGQTGIFSCGNIRKLKNEYRLHIINPQKLAKLISFIASREERVRRDDMGQTVA